MKYKAEIDGLRALAIAPVVLFHAGFPLFSGGYVGVDVFFVISGYLITSLILGEVEQSKFSLAAFYERRARRILPALFVVILACAPLAWFLMMPSDLASFGKSAVAVVMFSSNILFWRESGYFDAAAELKPLLHTWSLGVEEQFYLFFPWLVVYGRRLGPAIFTALIASLAVASLCIAQWGVANNQVSATFFLLPTRAWELLLGSLAAIYILRSGPAGGKWVKEVGAWAGVSLLLYSVFAFNRSTPFPGVNALVPTIGTFLIIIFASTGNSVGYLLSSRFLVWLGLMSYSTYLWHQPMFAFAQYAGFAHPGSKTFAMLALSSLVMGYLSWRFVERPFRKRADSHGPTSAGEKAASAVLRMSAIGSLAVLALGAFLLVIALFSKESLPAYAKAKSVLGPTFMRYVDQEDVRMPCGDPEIENSGRRVTCTFGTDAGPGSRVDVLLWGGSLAGALLFGLDREFKQRGISARAFIVLGCPPLLGMMNPQSRGCTTDVQRKILEELVLTPSGPTVLLHGNIAAGLNAKHIRLDGLPGTKDLVTERLGQARTELAKAGKRLVILEQGPTMPEFAAIHYVRQVLHGGEVEIFADRKQHLASLREFRQIQGDRASYIETDNFFCEMDRCPARSQSGDLIIYDANHLTKEYSVLFAGFIMSALEPIIRAPPVQRR